MRGLFVTATDTGVGKTILCASLLAAISSEGENVRAFKPAITGLNDEAEIAARGAWPPDHELLATLAGMDPMEVAPLRYGPAVSPHLAAQLAGEPIDPRRLLAHARGLLGTDEEPTLIVEGVGGLLVPLDRGLLHPRPGKRAGAGAADRGATRAGHDQPHTAQPAQRPRSRPARGRGSAHTVARAARRDRAVKPRDDRAHRRGRRAHARADPRPRPSTARPRRRAPAMARVADQRQRVATRAAARIASVTLAKSSPSITYGGIV